MNGGRALQGAERELVPQLHHFLGASTLVVASVMASVIHQSEAVCPPFPVTSHLGLSHLIVTQLNAGWVRVTSITKENNMSQEYPLILP